MKLPEIRNAVLQLASTPSLLDKKDLLAHYLQDEDFSSFVRMTLDPYKKYGFKQLPALPKAPDQSQGVLATRHWSHYASVLEALANREVTGDAAKALVRANLARLQAPLRETFKWALLKDLRAGVGARLVNEVRPGLIPEFGVMLADPLTEKKAAKLPKKVYLQHKKNGDRMVVICRLGHTPECYSRKGHRLWNYQTIANELQELTERVGHSRVWDGEAINSSWNGNRSTKKLAGNDAVDAVFHVFDSVRLDQWESRETQPFGKRWGTTRKIFREHIWEGYEADFASHLALVPTFVIQEGITWQQLRNLCGVWVAAGEEGVIVRLDEPYNFTTRSSMFKLKIMETWDCVILEVEPGEEGKKHEHHAGALRVELPAFEFQGKRYEGVSQSCGIKGTDGYRDWLWKNRTKLVGCMTEVRFQELTMNLRGEPNMQFAVSIKLREDKD